MVIVMVIALAVLCSASFGVAESDLEGVRQLADKYLSAMPDNGYYFSADELVKRITSGRQDFVIVDVREKVDKFKSGHIPGAIYINFKDIAKPENLAKLPKEKDILLYCNTGHEESKVLMVLRMMGYKAYALKFGYVAWKKEKPTEMMMSVIDNADKKNYLIER